MAVAAVERTIYQAGSGERRFWQLACFALGPIMALATLGVAPWVIVTGVLLSAAAARREGLALLPRGALPAALAVFIIWAAIASTWSTARPHAVFTTVELVYTLGPAALLMRLAWTLDDGTREAAIRALVAGLAVGLVLLAIETFGNMAIYRLANGLSWSAPYKENIRDYPATAGVLAALVVASAAVRAGAPRRAAWTLGLFFVVVMATHSLSAKVGIVVALAVVWFAMRAERRVEQVLAGVTMAGFVLAIPVALALKRLGLEDATWLPGSSRQRVEIWSFAADRILHRPLFGWGFDASRHIDNAGHVSKFLPPGSSIIPLHPHDLFLQVWLELGVPGVLIVGALMLTALRSVRRLGPAIRPFALAAYAAAIAMSSTAFGATQGWWMASLAAAMIGFNLTGRMKQA